MRGKIVFVLGMLAPIAAHAASGPSTNLIANDDDDARARCVTHYFGKSVTPNLGGDGVVFAGGVFPRGGTPRFAIAPGFAATLGFNVRLSTLTDRCFVQLVGPPSSYLVRVFADPVWTTSFSAAAAPSALPLINVSSDSTLQASFAIMGVAGLRFQRIWWDDSSSSRNLVTLPVGISAGYGTLNETSKSGTVSTGAFLLGVYLGIRLEL